MKRQDKSIMSNMRSSGIASVRLLPALLGILCLLPVMMSGCADDRREEEEVIVYAAASLRDVMQELSGPFRESGVKVVFNFAGSNVLAQQIEAAPAADVFLSADEQWMDHLQEAGRIVPESRRIFASNRLVIVAHRDSRLHLQDPAQLADLDFRHLSLADPEAVPAGRYARQYLRSLVRGEALWELLKARVAPAPDVRAALALVEADPEIVGIVYRTDAACSKRVKVLYQVPEEKGPDIRYSAALVKNAPHRRQGERFLEFLSGPQARRILQSAGFGFGAAE